MSNGVDVRIDYPMVEDMSSAFTDASTQLEETIAEMNKIVAALEGGALLGKTGDALAQAIRIDLINSIKALRDKMKELAMDTRNVVAIMRDGDKQARSRFL